MSRYCKSGKECDFHVSGSISNCYKSDIPKGSAEREILRAKVNIMNQVHRFRAIYVQNYSNSAFNYCADQLRDVREIN